MITDKLYTDIEPSLAMGWNRDLAKVTGDRSVKNSIIGIVSTRKNSRPFNPDYGCDISDELFENMTPLSAEVIHQSITEAIKNFEPRVSKLFVEVTPMYDSNAVAVTIAFSIIDSPEQLDKIRLQLSN